MKKQIPGDVRGAQRIQGASGDRENPRGSDPSAPMFKFRVGDVCITQNSKYGEVNDGAIVVIRNILPGRRDRKGQLVPYRIERVDGSTFAVVDDQQTGAPVWFRFTIAVCAESKLRKLRPDEGGESIESDLPVMEAA
jgi:hypothetical protein